MAKVTLFTNPHGIPCEIYTCRNMSEWFVGVEGATLANAFRLCDDCARHLANNIPLKLHPDGEKLIQEQQKQQGIEAKKEEERLAKETEKEQRDLAEALKKLQAELLEKANVKEEVEEKAKEPTLQERIEAQLTLKCLECGEIFTEKKALSAHMKTHKEG